MPAPLKRLLRIVVFGLLLPALGLHLAVTLLFRRRRPVPATGTGISFIAPYPPGDKSGGSTAIRALLDTLTPAMPVTVVPLYELRPPPAWRVRLGDLLTAALPMPEHCRPFIAAPHTVRARLVPDRPVLIEFLSGSLFLFFGAVPAQRLILRDHEVLVRRLQTEAAAATGLRWLDARLRLAVCALICRDIYAKVDAIVALTPADAAFLRERYPAIAAKVTDIPVSIDSPESPPASEVLEPRQLLLLANFYHRPNIDALLWFLEACAPHLAPGLTLHLCGLDQPLAGVRVDERHVTVVRHGYVPDIGAVLPGVRIAVAPVVSGGGVRMKNLFLAAQGMAIVTTPLGNEGIGFAAGREALICGDGREMAAAINRLVEDPERIGQLGRAAWQRVRTEFSHTAVRARYQAALAGAA